MECLARDITLPGTQVLRTRTFVRAKEKEQEAQHANGIFSDSVLISPEPGIGLPASQARALR